MLKPSSKPLAYSYIRMSTDAQLKGDSLRRQTELSRAYTEQHGLQLVTDFELKDIGVSAYKGDNATTGALRRFLDVVEAGKVPKGSYLLVESLDRLSRDRITAAMQLFLSIVEGGVNIVTLSDGQVYRTGQTDFTQLITSMVIMSRANEESQIKSQRIGAAWKNKRLKAGEEKLTSKAPLWLQLSADRKSFSVVEERAEVIRRIFKLAGDGHGTYSITTILNRDQVPAFGNSNGWNESYVEKILKSRAVLGEFQPHSRVEGVRRPSGNPIQGYYPAIISETQFLAVQAGRRARATNSGGRKGEQLKNLFTHIATCAYCGAPMRMVDKGAGPKGGRYLKCSSGVRGLGCTKKGWRYADFERSFFFLAKEVDLHKVLNAEAMSNVEAEHEQQLAALTEKMEQLHTQRDRLVELAGDPAVGVDFIRGKLADIQSNIVSTNAKLEALRQNQPSVLPVSDRPEDVRTLIDQLGKLDGREAFELRSRLAHRLRSMIKSLTISTEGDRPKLAKTREFLTANDVEPEFRDAVLQRIEEVAVATQQYNPGFKVIFIDGTVRKATVTTSDPTMYISHSVLMPDGSVDVELAGLEGDASRLFPRRVQ